MANQEVLEIDPTRSAEYFRDEIMRFIRTEQETPWQKMTQAQQERTVSRVEHIARCAVFEVARAILEYGSERAAATLTNISGDKAKITAKLTFHEGLTDEEKVAIIDRIGGPVVVVLMDPGQFQDIKTKIAIEPDAPELPLRDGTAGQPDWSTVGAAVAEGEGAGVPEEVEEVEAAPGGDLLDDEDMPPEEVAGLVDIPDPTRKGAVDAEEV